MALNLNLIKVKVDFRKKFLKFEQMQLEFQRQEEQSMLLPSLLNIFKAVAFLC